MEFPRLSDAEFRRAFCNRPKAEQYRLLSSLISLSDNYMKWRLKNLVNSFESIDILSLLPPELQLHLLSYIDGCTLLKACRVSKAWNKIIKGFENLWREKSLEIGVYIDDKPFDWSWDKTFVKSMKEFHFLNTGKAFSERMMNLKYKHNDYVKVIDYCDGFLCTVSENSVIQLWMLNLQVAVLTFRINHPVSCIKFKPFTTLVCGHFTGNLTTYDLNEVNLFHTKYYNGKCSSMYTHYGLENLLQNTFETHTGPVFSCDLCEDMNLVVSGGGDKMIKFWNLRNGQLIHSINSGSNWALKVVLFPSRFKFNRVLAMSRDVVQNYQWPKNPPRLFHFEESDPTEYFSNVKLANLTNSVPLNTGDDDLFTATGFQIRDDIIGLVVQDLQEKYSKLNILDIDTFELRSSVPLNFKVQKYLGLGKAFSAFLSTGKTLYTSTFIIINNTTGVVYGSHPVPLSRTITPAGPQLVMGDIRWLDGLRGWEFCGEDNIRAIYAQDCICGGYEINSIPPKKWDTTQGDGTCPECYNERRCQPFIGETSFLLLASATKSEEGQFFTLWWRRGVDGKEKED